MLRRIVLISFCILSEVVSSYAGVEMGVSISDEGLQGFYLSAGDYFRVPQNEIVKITSQAIEAEEAPVVFFLAQKAHVSPIEVVTLKHSGKSWFEITLHYGLSPEIFHVPVKTAPTGPPYGKAYGHFKKKPGKKEWKNIRFTDSEVVDLVNLKFISEYHKYPADEIIMMRGKGEKFVVINDEIKLKKKDNKEQKEKKEKKKTKKKGKKY